TLSLRSATRYWWQRVNENHVFVDSFFGVPLNRSSPISLPTVCRCVLPEKTSDKCVRFTKTNCSSYAQHGDGVATNQGVGEDDQRPPRPRTERAIAQNRGAD